MKSFLGGFLFMLAACSGEIEQPDKGNQVVENQAIKQVTSEPETNKGKMMDEQDYVEMEKNAKSEYADLIYDAFYGKYLKEVSEEEKRQLYNNYIDLMANDYKRFDRMEKMPLLNQNALEKQEAELEKMLDKCNSQIGDLDDDSENELLHVKKGVYVMIHVQTLDRDLLRAVQPNYLTGRVRKVVKYLYPPKYDLSDFQYDLPEDRKKNRIEKEYQTIYLKIKAAGLLRKMDDAYYPKSLVRAHADKSGLTKYIREKEKAGDGEINHAQLASEYFGSEQKWVKALNQFINQKMK